MTVLYAVVGAAAAAAATLAAATATTTPHTVTYNLYHRVYHPTLDTPPYSQHATVLIEPDNSVSFLPSPSLSEDLAAFSDSIKGLDASLDSLFYQIALQRGDQAHSSWDFSSVKACHLPQVTSQTIILHTQGPNPFAVDYFVSPTPPDGSCPKSHSRSKQQTASVSPLAAFVENVRRLNTTVLLKSSHTPPLPELRKPQPLTPTGQPIQPVPERSFLQKYWMYIVAIFIALMLAGGGEEEGPRRQAQA